MKITQIVESVGKGGAFSKIAFELTKQFLAKGIDPALITAHILDPVDERVEIHKVIPRIVSRGRSIKNYALNKIACTFVVPSFHIGSIWYIRKNKDKLGIVIDHTGIGGDVMVIHGCVLSMIKSRVKAGERSFLYYPLNHYRLLLEKIRYRLNRFKKAIAVSNRVKWEIVNQYGLEPNNVVVIPNGVNIEEFKFASHSLVREKIRKRYNIPMNAHAILFVGNNFSWKGLKYIIEAMSKIKSAYLLVIGSGLRLPFETLAKTIGVMDRVVFVGHVHDVKEFYFTSDLFVFPTIWEGFPLVVLEAMASGLPVLATRVGGTEDCLLDGYNGFFIERNADNIAKKVNHVLSNDSLRERLGVNGMKTAEEFDWSNVADQYIELCKSL